MEPRMIDDLGSLDITVVGAGGKTPVGDTYPFVARGRRQPRRRRGGASGKGGACPGRVIGPGQASGRSVLVRSSIFDRTV